MRLNATLGMGLSVMLAGQVSANEQWLLGDWGGKRSALASDGYTFMATYSGQGAALLDGGYADEVTARLAGNYGLGALLDLEKIVGWTNFEFRIQTTGYHGRSLAVDAIQDPRQPVVASGVQEIYSSRQFWRLGSLWLRHVSDDGRWDTKVGRMGEGEDFANPGCRFQNNALCGTLVGNGSNIWYNAPNAMWGLRLRYNASPNLQFQYGIYQHNPSYLTKRTAFNLSWRGSEGVMNLVEANWRTKFTEAELPGNYHMGAYYNTSNHKDYYFDINNQPQPITQAPFKVHSHRYGIYFVFNQQVTNVGGDNRRGLMLLFNTNFNDTYGAPVSYQSQVGMKFKGPFASRIQDDIGVAVSRMRINERKIMAEHLRNQLNNVSDYNDPLFEPIQYAEYAAEIHYTYNLSTAVMLRPNVQFIRYPGGVKEVKDAVVGGLSLRVAF